MFQQTQGVGTESSDSTLAEGRAALDVVTRNILTRTSGRTCYEEGPARSVGGVLITGYTLAGCPPARKNIDRLWHSLRLIFHCRLCETASAFPKNNQQHFCYWLPKSFDFSLSS